MDIFSLDSILELIDKSKSKIKKELDMKILDNDKLSLESDKLLQVLDYNPKTRYSEKDIMSTIPPIKLNPTMPEKKVQKKNKHIKLVSTPNIDMDSFAIDKNIERTTNFATKLESLEKSGNKESDNSEKKEEKKEENKEENSNKDNLSINNKNLNEFNDNNDFDNIIRIGFTINPFLLNYDNNKKEENSNEKDKNNNNENNNPEFEELFPKLCISSIIYTSHNLIENTIPFLNNKILNNSQLYWDLGWLDIENQIYYQTSGIFTSIINDKILYFEKFIAFLQYFIDNNNIAINLFESFNFQKSILTEDNRYLDEKLFEEQLNNYLENIDDGEEKKIFINFITSILIDSDIENNIENKISYIKLRRLINNNLYNFKFFSN